jgi:WD40 repeat protein
VWDVVAGKKLGEVTLPDVGDLSAALSPDGKTLVTAGVRREEKGPGKVVVAGWELATGKKLGEYAEENQGFGIVHVAVAGDNRSAVVVGPREGAMVVDAVAGTKTRALEAEGKRAGAAPVVSPDGKTVAIATPPGFGPTPTYSVLVFDIESGKLKKTLEGLSGAPTAAAFSPDGKLLLTGSADTTALVWEVGG